MQRNDHDFEDRVDHDLVDLEERVRLIRSRLMVIERGLLAVVAVGSLWFFGSVAIDLIGRALQ